MHLFIHLFIHPSIHPFLWIQNQHKKKFYVRTYIRVSEASNYLIPFAQLSYTHLTCIWSPSACLPAIHPSIYSELTFEDGWIMFMFMRSWLWLVKMEREWDGKD